MPQNASPQDLRITLAQINPTVGDLTKNSKLILEAWANAEAQNSDLIVFCELSLSGYPLQDLTINSGFLKAAKDAISDISAKSKHLKCSAFIGCPYTHTDGRIYNAMLHIHNGMVINTVFKHHLPDYGVFDESRVFSSAPLERLNPIEFKGRKLGVMICEDMWFSDVAQTLANKGADILIVPNASPFYGSKNKIRMAHAQARAQETKLPLIYTQLLGGQDELVFDGYSFAINANGDAILNMKGFEPDVQSVTLSNKTLSASNKKPIPKNDTLSDIYGALVLGLKDYVHKSGFKKALIGLSGGVDSALTAVIACDALGADNVQCVMMPSKFTSQESLDDASALAKNLGCELKNIDIGDTVANIEHTLLPTLPKDAPDITFENIQSRARGVLLMALSNATGAMVITTGNKSEMAVGYATLYGDMCGGFNALKDVYKTQVYALCDWLNAQRVSDKHDKMPLIPTNILTRAPSAELRENQTDQDSLPDYDILDAILKLYIEDNLSISDTIAKGYDKTTVERVWTLLHRSEYKRNQSAPGTKITRRAFDKDRRYPIVNAFGKVQT